ncbi:50S ribosomal protein L18 [Methanosarcinales archaeon]|nr:MAG: 50S ribosomal protein L18 [Methanosarcinales archaeon]
MATGSNYRVPLRRRREGKTNYRKRLRLLLSKKPRMVVRKTNKMIILQLVEFSPEGDRTVLRCDGRTLRKFGYEGSLKSVPASYLIGLLFGYEALKRGYKEAILDMGLHTSSRGSRIYAAVKGALDAGLHVPCSEEVIPEEERIRGEHIKDYRGVEIPFEQVKKNIISQYESDVQ